MAGNHADVGDPEVFEQLARLGESNHRRPEPLAQLEDGLTDDRDPLDRPVIGTLAVVPCPGELDLAQVPRERADGRADRHLVVVHDDEHLRLPMADVVEGLERQAAHQRRVTDDDRDPLHAVAKVTGFGQPFGDRKSRPGMPAIEDVVRRFGAAREAAHPAELPEGRELLEPAGQQLVRIRLVTGVPARCGRGAIRAAGGGRSSTRRRRATSRGGRPSSRRSERWSRGSRQRAERAGSRRGLGDRQGLLGSGGWTRGGDSWGSAFGAGTSRLTTAPRGV